MIGQPVRVSEPTQEEPSVVSRNFATYFVASRPGVHPPLAKGGLGGFRPLSPSNSLTNFRDTTLGRSAFYDSRDCLGVPQNSTILFRRVL